jgi:CDP-diacylglycerol--serine O-phosphatidyltransferase
MFLGFLAIGLILNGQPLKAGVFIIVAGLFDVFDGKIARMLGIESQFGVEFDSMADTVSFCVVPSILVYSLYVDGLPPLLGGLIAFIPLMFGTIRLAKFNVDQEPGKPKSYTVGLTTPIATITLFSYVFFNHQIDGDFGDPRTALMVVSGLGILMVSPIHFAKFPLFSFKSGRANSVLLIGFIISMISLAIWQGFVLMPLVAIYIGWNIIKWLIHPRRNDTFTEIDP